MADIESLGIQIHAYPTPGAKPYAVVGGRSNARWWLIPLQNGRVTASGLALFQPLLASARIMKTAATVLSLLGLSRLWARNKVYIAGEPSLAHHFPSGQALTFAYFTGTDSPHRKVAVQIMDRYGHLKSFAKLTRHPKVRSLLAHEAEMLEHVRKLNLQTAHVPKVLFYGEQDDSTLLVTDTLKTACTRSTTQLTKTHLDFVQELAHKTADPRPICASELASEFRARFDRIRPRLNQAWSRRINDAISALQAQTDLQLPSSLSHGDFTPWNTFLSNGRLYVFDWEYAETQKPASYDLIHFLLTNPAFRIQTAKEQIKRLVGQIKIAFKKTSEEQALTHIGIYLIVISLRYIERNDTDPKLLAEWAEEKLVSSLLDDLIGARAITGE